MKTITRFAPSPTGRLHIGHAWSAVFARDEAVRLGGSMILRIEDIDTTRCNPEFEAGIYEDLQWLGLEWPKPVRRQSDHFDFYRGHLDRLESKGLIYPCFCTRKEIQAEIENAGGAPHGPEGALYPGTCRHLSADERKERIEKGEAYALRLDTQAAIDSVSVPLHWNDLTKGEQVATPEILGDVVLARKDTPASYHLCVTVDDDLQDVTLVTRGEDLFYATHMHRLLQDILEIKVPEWNHHGLLLDEEGKRFAKRNNSVTLQHMREEQGLSPQDVLNMMTNYLGCLIVVFLLFCTLPAYAAEKPLELENIVASSVKQSKHKNFVTLAIENDSIGKGTDQNYTSGVRVSYFNVNAEIPETIDRIADFIPTFDINPTTSIFWSLGQNLYTPDDIERRDQDPNDRPWAAWLYGSAGLATVTNNHIDELELTLGVVGPSAIGEWTQDNVHKLIESRNPNGWDNQLENEPGFIVSWQRRWPQAVSFSTPHLNWRITPNAGITVGNIYDYVNAGAMMTIGPANELQDTPQRVRPAMPGSGFFTEPENDWSWMLFAGADGRAVAHNIFLDGNMFRDSHQVDKEYFVGDLTGGLAFTYKRMRLSYSLVYRTKEFKSQDESDLFGSVTLSFRY